MPNRLIHEQSPYLLQHAHNPVDWYPWGDEAFEKASSEHKPVIVSIGYAACHWCHVMERESFEDETTAAFMNEHFVCVKVDREEHPDVDAYFMDAVQAISGSGGWPLNAFATPQRIPFFAGTYFPPRPAFNRPSWMQVLQRMHEIWTTQQGEVSAQSAQMLAYLKQVSLATSGTAAEASKEDCEAMAQNLLQSADSEWGGFGAAPKFPGTMALEFLLEHHQYTGHKAALNHALLSLDKMIAGGIYDQLGGGFARYSTDRQWLAPHFEKMLYDNAQLVLVLCAAYRLTGQVRYREVITDTIGFVNRELRGPEGAFFSALDADSEGEEGRFYTWTWQEWLAATGGGNAVGEVCFGVCSEGNWEGTNILHEALSVDDAAGYFNMTPEAVKAELNGLKKTLFQHRAGRVRPLTDDKSLLSWNALMNRALTAASVALEEPAYLQQAGAHLRWMSRAFAGEKEQLMHVWKAGSPRILAKLDDYAFLAQAMLAFGAASGANEWIAEAGRLCESALELFVRDGSPFLYLSSSLQTDIPVRKAEVYDGVMPSANAAMAGLLQTLGMLLERSQWLALSEEMIGTMFSAVRQHPYSFGQWAILLQRSLAGPKTVVVSGRKSRESHAELLRRCPPHVIVLDAQNAAEKLALTADKKSGADSLIFVCTARACMPPVSGPQDALLLL
jgi:uncharacterized protein YyaL (SSP411 family)